mmetsp:Transcript_8266/g.51511  ORF Transcript_8266/g.51511 Transcript_8266/m.51511 type:complete len:425 (+) Transcript_8266:2292-3566(+)
MQVFIHVINLRVRLVPVDFSVFSGFLVFFFSFGRPSLVRMFVGMSSVRLCRQPPAAASFFFFFSVSIPVSFYLAISMLMSLSASVSASGPGSFPFFSWIRRRPGPPASAFFGFSSFPSIQAAVSPRPVPSLFFQPHEQLEHGQRRPPLVFDDELVEVRFFSVQFAEHFIGAVGSFRRSVRHISEPHPPRFFQVSVLERPSRHRGDVQRLGRIPSVRHAVPGQRRRRPVPPRIAAVRFHRHDAHRHVHFSLPSLSLSPLSLSLTLPHSLSLLLPHSPSTSLSLSHSLWLCVGVDRGWHPVLLFSFPVGWVSIDRRPHDRADPGGGEGAPGGVRTKVEPPRPSSRRRGPKRTAFSNRNGREHVRVQSHVGPMDVCRRRIQSRRTRRRRDGEVLGAVLGQVMKHVLKPLLEEVLRCWIQTMVWQEIG